jgi:hypothetical protein
VSVRGREDRKGNPGYNFVEVDITHRPLMSMRLRSDPGPNQCFPCASNKSKARNDYDR